MGAQPATKQTPEQLDSAFLQVWMEVGRTYHDQSKLHDWGKWPAQYKGKFKTQADLEAALKEMLASLNDKWTVYTPANELAKAAANADAGVHSLGFTIIKQNDGTFALDYRTYGTQAYASDMRRGDVIKSVGGKNLAGLSLDQAKQLLAGKDGDKVEVVYSHDGTDDKVTLTFAATPAARLQVQQFPNNIIAAHFPNYMSEPGLDEFHRMLVTAEAKSNNALNGVILDLRGNPGGRYDLALRFTSVFMDSGVVVQSRTRDGRTVHVAIEKISPPLPYQFNDKTVESAVRALYTVPMVILVDENTASAAEVVSGAFKDNDRAIIIGSRTYGKGVGYIVKVLRFSRFEQGGALQITHLDYLTPKGSDLSNKGLAPDVQIAHPRGSHKDEAMAQALIILNGMSNSATSAHPKMNGFVGDTGGLQAVLQALAVSLILLGIVLWAVYTHQRQRRADDAKKKNDK
jgi:carboxyl-terminal processing protease